MSVNLVIICQPVIEKKIFFIISMSKLNILIKIIKIIIIK